MVFLFGSDLQVKQWVISSRMLNLCGSRNKISFFVFENGNSKACAHRELVIWRDEITQSPNQRNLDCCTSLKCLVHYVIQIRKFLPKWKQLSQAKIENTDFKPQSYTTWRKGMTRHHTDRQRLVLKRLMTQ